MNGFYWIYLIVFALFIAYTVSKVPEWKTLVYDIACGVLILLFVIQDASVSFDTAEYMLQYSLVPGMGFAKMLGHEFDIGYNLLCKLLSVLFTGERVLFVAMALLILVPFFIWFRLKENNRPLSLLEAHTPKLYGGVMHIYDKRWFRNAVQIAMFAVLFVWYVTELDGAVYMMAPV